MGGEGPGRAHPGHELRVVLEGVVCVGVNKHSASYEMGMHMDEDGH